MAATIISAIIGAGAAITGGVMQNEATRKARNEAKRLGAQEREDVLAQRRREERMGHENLRLQKAGLGFQQQEAALSRAERNEDRATNKKQQSVVNALNLLNQNQGLADQLLARFGRR